MLPGEKVLPENIVSGHGDLVNELFLEMVSVTDRVLRDGIKTAMKGVQAAVFEALRDHLACPRCQVRDIVAKGWRQRIIKSSRGRLVVPVRQARCRQCGRTFRPLNDLIGLPGNHRFLRELVEKAVALGVRLPFAASSTAVKMLTQGSISAEGIRQKIAAATASISLPEPEPGATVLVDSTKVRVGSGKKGVPVHLAITAKRGKARNGRAFIEKQVIHLGVGESGLLKQRLKKLGVSRIVHDGGEDYGGVAKDVQRCRWHLVSQLWYHLWRDGVAAKDSGPYREELARIVWSANVAAARERLEEFIETLEVSGCACAAGYLKAAREEAWTYHESAGFAFSTTSPIEREMRELNRRADVGVRWSAKGIENVLKVGFHQRLNLNRNHPENRP